MESEFLSESTHKLRKSLLIASLVGYAISKAGLKVTKVSLLGSELAITKFEVIPFVLGIVVLYLLVSFIAFANWDSACADLRVRAEEERAKKREDEETRKAVERQLEARKKQVYHE